MQQLQTFKGADCYFLRGGGAKKQIQRDGNRERERERDGMLEREKAGGRAHIINFFASDTIIPEGWAR